MCTLGSQKREGGGGEEAGCYYWLREKRLLVISGFIILGAKITEEGRPGGSVD